MSQEFCQGCDQWYDSDDMQECPHCLECYCNKSAGYDCIGDHIDQHRLAAEEVRS